MRSRVRWYEEGENSSSSYFLKLERRNFECKLIPCLNVGERTLYDFAEILTALSEHYGNIFRKSRNDNEKEIDNYLKDVKTGKLSSRQVEMLEGEITVEEIGKTLKNLNNNRSPGSDGFPYEFYKVFWNDVKHFVHRSLKDGVTTGRLSITQRERVILY